MSLLIGMPQNWDDLEETIAAIQTWVGKQEGLNTALQTQQSGLASAISVAVPVGGIVLWTTATAPTGYLLCDGSAVDRTTYATLFSIIGVTYGSGNGSSTFNVPDLRGRFALGTATSGTGSTLAGTGGSINHTHTGPSHTHSVSGSTGLATVNHSHTFSTTSDAENQGPTIVDNNLGGSTVAVAPASHTHPVGGTTAGTVEDTTHSHGVGSLATELAGTGSTGTANPPFLALHYIIRT